MFARKKVEPENASNFERGMIERQREREAKINPNTVIKPAVNKY
jgi:hypothetical protein